MALSEDSLNSADTKVFGVAIEQSAMIEVNGYSEMPMIFVDIVKELALRGT